MEVDVTKSVMLAALALALSASSASALTITNKGKSDHRIGIDMGDKERVETIAAGKSLSLKSECNDGCGFTGPWSFSWMAKTGENFAFDDKTILPGGSS